MAANGYYQRRDPRPPLALELAQSLITETMAQGDRLVVLTFDNHLHDAAGEILALSPLHPPSAVLQFEKLPIRVSTDEGTVRTAALGRAVKALEDLSKGAERSATGIIYVVTDRDGDSVPAGGEKQFYDYAKQLEHGQQLTCLSRIPQGGMILEVWQWKGSDVGSQPASPVATIQKVQQLLKDIIPGRPVTSGPVSADFGRGRLILQTDKRGWRRTARGEVYELPVRVVSSFSTLHFRGRIMPNLTVRTPAGTPIDGAKAVLLLPNPQPTLAPNAVIEGRLRLAGLPRPGLLALSEMSFRLHAVPRARGVVTAEPSLFSVPDAVATAKVSGALWATFEPTVVTEPRALPTVPPTAPPRVLQAVVLVLVLLLAYLLIRALLPAPVPPLVVQYWIEGCGSPSIATLNGTGSSVSLDGVSAGFARSGSERAIVVSPELDAVLMDAGHKEHQTLHFEKGGRFIVKGADSSLTAVNFDFGQVPPEPAPASGDAGSEELLEGVAANEPAGADEWGLGDR